MQQLAVFLETWATYFLFYSKDYWSGQCGVLSAVHCSTWNTVGNNLVSVGANEVWFPAKCLHSVYQLQLTYGPHKPCANNSVSRCSDHLI